MSDERLPELFEQASALDHAGREELLAGLRRESPALADELERLLRFEVSAPSPLDAKPWLPPDLPPAGLGTEAVPAQIGRFRLLRELGRGGMGRVFLAEEQTEDFRRTVALKLIDRPGPDDDAVRRFRDEVRILASLEHPGIARFLDGGRSPEGVWFLAIEYVDGRGLLEHARAAELGLRARVRLFAAVADAVAYAHGRGVVHRDLKPSNVMVGVDGRPRLLDFGISKRVDPAADHAGITHTQWQPLTPAYASPEQFRGERVSPRSDVYSLGVMLYELLTGRRPFAKAGESRLALERAVLDSDPEPPSTAAREERRRETGTTTTRPRGRRRAEIGRDLDAICLQALRRDPYQRYDSAAALRDDLRRWLDGLPVVARRRTWWSDAGSRLRSHRRGLAAAAAILVVAGALALGLARWRRAGAPAAPVAAATLFPFDPANPPAAEESERRLAEAPADLVAGTALVLRLARDDRRAEAAMVVGRMREVPGNETEPLVDYAEGRIASLAGEDQRALVFYTRARDLALAAGRVELLGTIRTSRAATLSKLGQREASLAELEAARADSEKIGDLRTLYRTLNGLALEHLQAGEMARGRADLEAALAAADQVGIEPLVTLENLAAVHAIQGRPDLGEPLARRLIEGYRQARRPEDVGEVGKSLALMLRDLGRSPEADPLLEESLTLLADSTHGNVLADALHAQATADLEDGRLDRQVRWIAELEATAQRSRKRLPLGYAKSLRGRRAALAGDLAGAREEFAEAQRLMLASGDRDLAAMSALAWAQAEAAAGEAAAAGRVLDDALGRLEQPTATLAGYFGELLRSRLDAQAGRTAEARRRLQAAGDEAAAVHSLPRRLEFLSARAALAAAEGRAADARSDLEAALAAARSDGRTLAELELRLALVGLSPSDSAQRDAALALERDARAAGFTALAERARSLADPRANAQRL